MSLLAALTVLGGSGCTLPPPASGAVPPELRLEGVRFRFYRNDSLRAYGVAEGATLRRDSSVLRARNIVATLPRGDEPVVITAPAGEGSLRDRTFQATGGILVASGADTARTERARFDPEGSVAGVIRGEDPVIVIGRGYRLTGSGFTLDPEAGSIVVRGGATLVAGLSGGE